MAVVWQLSAVQFSGGTLLKGVLLSRSASKVRKRNAWSNFLNVSRSYFRKPCKRCRIVVAIDGATFFPLQTDDSGAFELELQLTDFNEIAILSDDHKQDIPVIQRYPVIFKNTESDISIISDIDDTLLVSHTLSFRKRLGTLFFVPAHKRKPVSFIKSILDYVHERKGRVFYVSRSESNLFALISSFIYHYNLPEGPISLTSYLRYNQLLDSKKGTDYKKNSIRKILQLAPEKRFLLLGDDTQNDMEVYASIISEFPDQIVRIYIRKTMKKLNGSRQEQRKALDEHAGKFCYFSDEDDVQKALELIEKEYNA